MAARAAARAARAGSIADNHAHLALHALPPARTLHERSAVVHRRSQARQLVVSTLWQRHAEELAGRSLGCSKVSSPRLIETVATLSGGRGVYVSLATTAGTTVVVASDESARTAHNVEVVLGEGPAQSCLVEGPLLVSGSEVQARWPLYAEAIGPLEVESLASVPLKSRHLNLGTLTTLDPPAGFGTEAALERLCVVGEAVVDVLRAEVSDSARHATGLLGHMDYKDELHQAAGVIAVQQDCAIGDALALLRARSFATGTDVDALARAVIAGELHLDF